MDKRQETKIVRDLFCRYQATALAHTPAGYAALHMTRRMVLINSQ
jgi:hypothetical protein